MARLRVEPPDRLLRVTEHVEHICSFASRLERAGFAYEILQQDAPTGEGGLYFSVTALEQAGIPYARLLPGTQQNSASGAVSGKRDPRDFALWKTVKPGEPSWESPWGPGRPGWHIECSAMTLTAAGPHLDLHAGGSDLCFPHHVNEMAQSEALLHLCNSSQGSSPVSGDGSSPASGDGSSPVSSDGSSPASGDGSSPVSSDGSSPASGDGSSPAMPGGSAREWVRLWVHPGPLTIRGRKMSKSLKNFVTVDALLDAAAPGAGTDLSLTLRGADPADAFRLFCMRHPYRSAVGFSEGALEAAAAQLRRWCQFIADANAATAEAAAAAREAKAPPGRGGAGGGEADRCGVAAAGLRAQVARCLAADLDTPAAVEAIAGCVSLGRAALDARPTERGAWDPFPVYRCAEEVGRVAQDLGLASLPPVFSPHSLGNPPVPGAATLGGGAGSAALGGDSSLRQLEATSAVLQAVRTAVRAEALAAVSDGDSADVGNVAAKQLAARILRLSDAVRDAVLPALAPWVDARDGTHSPQAVFTGSDGPAEDRGPLGDASAVNARALELLRAAMTPRAESGKPASPPPDSGPQVAPEDMFRQDSGFASWDEDGIPLTMQDGTELSRSQRNKFRSKQKRYSSKWLRAQTNPASVA